MECCPKSMKLKLKLKERGEDNMMELKEVDEVRSAETPRQKNRKSFTLRKQMSTINNAWMDPERRAKENRLTRISLGIVWLFIFCHIWKLVPTIYEGFYGEKTKWPRWLEIINDVSHTLIVFNSAVNFLIYATF